MMPFEITDPLTAASFVDETIILRVSENTPAIVLLLRGLTGSTTIKHLFTNTQFNQEIDYLDLIGSNGGIAPLERLKNYISTDLTIEEFAGYFMSPQLRYKNLDFFTRLNNEFNNFHYYSKRESHTTAFLYLYRILESISYAFPLIYASKTNDFLGSFDSLRKWFSASQDDKMTGELGFFKSFIKTAFRGDPLLESTVTIEITAETVDIQAQFFKAFKKACPKPEVFDETDTQEPSKLAIKFSEYSSFIANVRNRFFHLKTSSQPNLQSSDVLDSDYFFSLINRQSAAWISIVLIEIIKFLMNRLTVLAPLASPTVETSMV